MSGFLCLLLVSPCCVTLQANLRRAAKARIDRMVKPHAKRVHLNCPDFLKNEWATGDKNNMADLLMSVNFDKDYNSLDYIGLHSRYK